MSPDKRIDDLKKESLRSYRANLYDCLNSLCERDLIALSDIIIEKREKNQSAFIIGNGGSAAIADHVAVDWTKVLKLRTRTFNETSLMTCYANDYGHDMWFAEALVSYGHTGDLLVAISSSGNSPNIQNAIKYGRNMGMTVVTLSGFSKNNNINGLGLLNIWVDSTCYNHIELTHLAALLTASDLSKTFSWDS